MAYKSLEGICAKVQEKWDIIDILIIHRFGKLKVKEKIVLVCKEMISIGFNIIATSGTSSFLKNKGIEVKTINKVREGRPHLVDSIKDGLVQIIFNTTEGQQSIKESFSLRRAAITYGIPYYTTIAGCKAATEAIISLKREKLGVASIQSY